MHDHTQNQKIEFFLLFWIWKVGQSLWVKHQAKSQADQWLNYSNVVVACFFWNSLEAKKG